MAHFRITHLFDSEVLIMGIQGLLPFLSTYKKEISFAELEGKVCGIDAYGWLYKGVYCAYELVTRTETTRHIDFIIKGCRC